MRAPRARRAPPGTAWARDRPRSSARRPGRPAAAPHRLSETGNFKFALTRKMAVHELYLSFEARLAPVLHTIDDPNHDGHNNGQEKHYV